MIKSELNQLEKFLDEYGVNYTETVNGIDYKILGKTLCVDTESAIDDETNTSFESVREVRKFYNLYCMPDDIITKADHDEYLIAIGLKIK